MDKFYRIAAFFLSHRLINRRLPEQAGISQIAPVSAAQIQAGRSFTIYNGVTIWVLIKSQAADTSHSNICNKSFV